MQKTGGRSAPRQSDVAVLVLEEHDSLWLPESRPEIEAARDALQDALRVSGYATESLRVRSPRELRAALARFDPRTHLVFNWHDGAEWGADDAAAIVATVEDLGFCCTGSGPRALLMTQDKRRTKRVMEMCAIATPPWQSVLGGTVNGWDCFPAIVKVATEHGSLTLTPASVVHNRRALNARVAKLERANPWRLMVAEFVDGREFAVSLWGNRPAEVLPLVEIDYSAYPEGMPRVRTYDSKWHAPSRTVCPARVPRAQRARIEQTARRVYETFELRDYARIDIRLRGDEPNVVDVNPNPDITAGSSFEISARHAGYDYPAMIRGIVRAALERRRREDL